MPRTKFVLAFGGSHLSSLDRGLTISDTHITAHSSTSIKVLWRGTGLAHKCLEASCNFLNNIMKNYDETCKTKIFCKDRKLIRPRRSLGQCNIVGDRNLVSYINNGGKQTKVGLVERV